MKFLLKMITFLTLTLSFSAFADSPSVGDYALYNLTLAGTQGTYRTEIVDFDGDAGTYTVKTTMKIGDEEVEDEQTVAEDEIATTETLEMVIQLCETEDLNGTLETIVIASESYESCRLTLENQDVINFGVVPFGIFQAVLEGGTKLQLIEFGFGKKE